MTERRGEVFDLGYQRYQGPREGRMRARKALFINGIRTALGLGRGTSAKILPILLFVSVMIPALVAVLIASVADIGDNIIDHTDYYRFISVILVLFSAIIAPELLCSDRRESVINLYLVRPMTPTDYVVGRWAAFFTAILVLLLLGQMVLLIGLTLAADEPLDYIKDNWLDVPRFVLAGIVVGIFTTTLPLAVAAFTTRRAYAAAFVIGILLISGTVGSILSECKDDAKDVRVAEGCEPTTGKAGKWLMLLNIPEVSMHVNDMIFDVPDNERTNPLVTELPAATPVVWYLVLVIVPGFALWWQYRRLKV